MAKKKTEVEIHTKLKLKRPLCFIDLETTGTDVENDRIVEITITKLNPDGTKETKTKRLNPEIPIAQEAIDKHGLTNEMLIDEPPFKKIAKGLLAFIDGCDIAGYNLVQFDAPMLYFEFQRVGVDWNYHQVKMVDMYRIFMKNEERSLPAAYKFYCNKELTDSHNSLADVNATFEVFQSQLEVYDDLPLDLEELDIYCNYDKKRVDIGGKFAIDEDGDIIFNFGQLHKGKKAHTEKGYLNWMIGKGTFSKDVNDIVEELLKK